MDFQIQDIMDWWEDNKEWLLIPAIVNASIVLLGIILILITGRDVGFIVKSIFVLLVIGAPFLGYFLGDYVDPYLEPFFTQIKGKIESITQK